MEFRVLKYFLTVAREENITNAAASLHVTQPTLSRQMADLEQEIGKPLFVRTNRKTTLTDDGMLLRKRAEEIISLMEQTELEFQSTEDNVYGEIRIGAGETDIMKYVANAAVRLKERSPLIQYHLFSGNADDVCEKLNHGLLDFGILFEPVDKTKYDYIPIPFTDQMGILTRKDSPYASRPYVTIADLEQMPLLLSSRQPNEHSAFHKWCGTHLKNLNVTTTYTLVYNASLMVEAGMGNAVAIDKLINTSGDSNLCFIPLYPEVHTNLVFVWKKYQLLSKASSLFLEEIKKEFALPANS